MHVPNPVRTYGFTLEQTIPYRREGQLHPWGVFPDPDKVTPPCPPVNRSIEGTPPSLEELGAVLDPVRDAGIGLIATKAAWISIPAKKLALEGLSPPNERELE